MTPTIRGGGLEVEHNATLRVWHRGVWHLPTKKNRRQDPSLLKLSNLGFRTFRKCRVPVGRNTL